MNYLDTRDLYTRKNELEALRDAVTAAREELAEADPATVTLEELEALREAIRDAESEYGEDEAGELAELEELESEISDFRHGETMIPVDRFTEYAEELAEDIGSIDRRAGWPLNCIDWDQAAKELSQDYTQVSYQGTDYYVRA